MLPFSHAEGWAGLTPNIAEEETAEADGIGGELEPDVCCEMNEQLLIENIARFTLAQRRRRRSTREVNMVFMCPCRSLRLIYRQWLLENKTPRKPSGKGMETEVEKWGRIDNTT